MNCSKSRTTRLHVLSSLCHNGLSSIVRNAYLLPDRQAQDSAYHIVLHWNGQGGLCADIEISVQDPLFPPSTRTRKAVSSTHGYLCDVETYSGPLSLGVVVARGRIFRLLFGMSTKRDCPSTLLNLRLSFSFTTHNDYNNVSDSRHNQADSGG